MRSIANWRNCSSTRNRKFLPPFCLNRSKFLVTLSEPHQHHHRTDAIVILNKHFALLCDVIAHYHADKSFVEREVFKLPKSADADDVGIVLDEPEFIFGSVSKIVDHFWMKMNADAVEKFIEGMTVYCEQQGMGIDNFNIGLKELIQCFRSCATDYICVASGEIACL